METNLFLPGFLLMITGGIVGSIFAFPLKYTKKWAWENTWGTGAFFAMILLPWPIAFITIPELGEVYRSVPASALIYLILFGIGWGVGGIFFGKGLDAVGFSIGLSLITGIICIGGSVIPLAINKPESFLELPGIILMAGILIMIVGLYYSAKAGMLREKDQKSGIDDSSSDVQKPSFKKGLIICVLGGLLSSLMNFGVIYGAVVKEASLSFGANPMFADNAKMALVFTANFMVNIIFCIYLLVKNKTFPRFFLPGTGKYWIMVVVMGLLWTGMINLYVIGTTLIGSLGAYLGFPVLNIVVIIAGYVFGVLTGEWKGASAKAKMTMNYSLAFLAIAIIVLGISMNVA